MKVFKWFWVLTLAILGCDFSTNSHNSDNTPKKGIYGSIVDRHGNRLKGVSVKAISLSSSLAKTSKVASDSVQTDNQGNFQLLVDPGTYNVQSSYENGSLVSLTPNVEVSNNEPTNIVDTIKEPGKIHGKISLGQVFKVGLGKVAAIDLSKASCFIAKVTPVYRADENGVCEIPVVPEGAYAVTFEYPKYLPAKESLQVESGKTIATNVSLVSDPESNPPTPVLKELVYDTLNGIVKLTWNKVTVPDFLGYMIYRGNANQTLLNTLNNKAITDTVFFDTLYHPGQDSSILDLIYMVKAQDSGLNVSDNYSNSLKIKAYPPNLFKSKITLTFNSKISIHDSVWIKASFANSMRLNDSVFWEVNGRKISRKLTKNSDSILVYSDSVQDFNIKCAVKDNFGYTWTVRDTVAKVQLFAPTLSLPMLTTITADTNYQITVYGDDRVGKIAKYEWDLTSDGVYDTVTSDPTLIVNLNKAGTLTVRATDDDGNKVVESAPYQTYYRLMGKIAKDTSLSPKSSPYLVDVDIDTGVTLTVLPGVKLALYSRYNGWGLLVHGNLKLLGTEQDSIQVYDVTNNHQSGVYFDMTSHDTAIFKYVHFKDMPITGINCAFNKAIDFTHNFFEDTHVTVTQEAVGLKLMDPASSNWFYKMNLQYGSKHKVTDN